MYVIYISLFIIGIILGSFYNVVGLRLPKNESIISPGSHCVNCNHKLSWYELIPVFSYIFLHGKCRTCKQKISWQYPLIELLTGVLFVISFFLFGINYDTLISLVLVSIVITTFISDCKYMVILDEVLIIASILLLVLLYFQGGLIYTLRHLLSGLLLFSTMLLIKVVGDHAFKQESLGWGDVKLSAVAGILLGFKLGTIYIFLGAVLALPYAIYQTIRQKNSMIPFGPFLVLSMIIIFWNSGLFLKFINILMGV